MPKVAIRGVMAGPSGVFRKGSVIEVGPLTAKRLIRERQAEASDGTLPKGQTTVPKFFDNDKDEKQWLKEVEAREAAETDGSNQENA